MAWLKRIGEERNGSFCQVPKRSQAHGSGATWGGGDGSNVGRRGWERCGAEAMLPQGLPSGSPSLAVARDGMLGIRDRRGIRVLRPALRDDPHALTFGLADQCTSSGLSRLVRIWRHKIFLFFSSTVVLLGNSCHHHLMEKCVYYLKVSWLLRSPTRAQGCPATNPM